MNDLKSPIKGIFSRKLLATVALTALLSGCSSVPDAINPVEWYKGARDAIMGTEEEKDDGTKSETFNTTTIPGESKTFPKLSSVPERPKATVEQERKRIAEGLVADQEKSRKYSDDVIRRQGDSANSLPTPPAVKVEQAPPPIAMPKPEVKVKAPIKPVAQRAPMPAPKIAKVAKPVASASTLKLRATSPSQMVKVPAVNPDSPRLGAIPGMAEALGQSETVVISGSGVQVFGARGPVAQSPAIAPGGKVAVSGVNSLAQFNGRNLQGSYQVATILFANGSAKVGARDRRVLRQVIAQHRQVGGTLRVVGHASRRTKTNDPIRHKMANFQVSTARAERVAKELVKLGAKANKLFVGSVSDREPRYYEYMPSGEAGNRRTEIYIDF